MDDRLTRDVERLHRAIADSLGSEISLLSAISEGMRLALTTRDWRFVEVTRQTAEEAVRRLTDIKDEAS